MREPARPREAALHAILGFVFASTTVHFTDNVVRYDRYVPAGSPETPITRAVVAVAWVVFTAFGVLGYAAYRRGLARPAAIAFVVYAVSGLISPLHYTQVAPSDYDALQNVFIVTDAVAGLALVAFAVRLATSPPGISRS